MQIVLLNFSDAPRSLVDRRNRNVTVGVGEMKAADIHESHFAMLKRGTFLALPEEITIPERTLAAVKLMGVVATIPYEELLQQFWGLAERDPHRLRPTRDEIRLALRDIAQDALATIGVGRPAPKRVSITEQGDENTRTDEDEAGGQQPQETTSPTEPPRQTPSPPRRQSSGNRPRQTVKAASRGR